ncbi:MAG TPA: hypothetical protein PKW95_04665 [bacterium]|nr:hypothetical protein [bacterium]
MKTHLFVLAMMLTLAVGLTIGLACDDDDDTDADSGASPDESTDGVCFWQCEEDQATTSSCLSGFADLESCGANAYDVCNGTVLATDWSADCTSCDDTSCWPDWHSAD